MRPRKRKWPKMTVTENDRIRLLKVIRKEAVDGRNIMIISKLVCVVVSACTMFCIVGTAHIPLLSTPVFLLFLRESWQNISRNSSFYPFHPTFSPSYFCLLKGWKVLSEPLFLASKSIFRSLRVIKVFQYLKSPLRFAMKIAYVKKGGLWVKIKLFSEKCSF